MGAGIPHILWFGEEGEYWCLVLSLCGPSLHDLFTFSRQKFSLKTVLLLADQILERIEFVHSKHTLHRDIKPANFLIGHLKDSGAKNVVHVIDFGLSRPFRGLEPPHTHIPFREEVSITGTARFASVRTHQGLEQSRRDDLEAIMYMLIYFLEGHLPWQNLKKKHLKNRREKHRELALLKQSTMPSVLMHLPSEFGTALKYIRGLAFDADPDYDHLRLLFRTLYQRRGYTKVVFDWTNKQLIGFEDEKEKEDDEKNIFETKEEAKEPDEDIFPNSSQKAEVADSIQEQIAEIRRRVAQKELKRKRSKVLVTWDKESLPKSPPPSSEGPAEKEGSKKSRANEDEAAVANKDTGNAKPEKEETEQKQKQEEPESEMVKSCKSDYSAFFDMT